MLQNSRIKRQGWHKLMEGFDLSKHDDTYDKLIAAYSEKHRAYHTLDHIEACFRHLDAVKDDTVHPHEIELALWFHDVIYAPFSKTNEEDSAELAKAFLEKNNVSAEVTKRIHDLIILTKDHAVPRSNDARFMLDIDLSILGASEHIYAQFEKDVRTEYKKVPAFIFKKKRKDILRSFAKRPHIYHTTYFSERLESQAKKNLAWAIARL